MKDRDLAVLSGIGLLAFLALALAVKYLPGLQSQDLQAALWINHLQLGDAASSVVVAASVYGREVFWIGLVAAMLLFGDKETKAMAVGLCAVFIAGIVAGELAKDIVARARPDQSLLSSIVVRIPLDTDYSFPSGHAVIVSIGAVFSLVTFRRKWVAGLLTIEAAVVCFSRVYTFEHYPTDVIAGVALGSAIALSGVLIGRKYLMKQLSIVVAYLVKLFRNGPLRL